MKTKSTPVIFKMEGKGKLAAPVAFFPTLPHSGIGYDCVCYAQQGQHGGADPSHAAALKPATPAQYEPLLRELVRIGYKDLVVVRKFTRQYQEQRRKAAK